MSQGATKAASAATELMNAIPTAADAPVRKFGARVQNTGNDAFRPMADRVNAAIFITGSSMNAAAATPAAASTMAPIRWYFRSIARSDLRPQRIIAMAPNAG